MTTAVIVHYRGGDHLTRCVDSCLAEGSISDVIIVDNEGGLTYPRSQVRVLAMTRNVGYGRAANAGLDAAATDPVVVLNQDVVLPVGALAGMLDAGRAAGAWVVGPQLVDLE